MLLSMIPGKSISQVGKFKDLKKLLLESDSVLLVSHQVTQVVIKDEKGRRTLSLISNNKLDRRLIIDKVDISNKSDRETLFKILTQPNTDKKIEMAKCLFPEHAIVMINKKKYSYLELSFSCHRVLTSNDIALTESDFSVQKWSNLEEFFSRMGIKFDK